MKFIKGKRNLVKSLFLIFLVAYILVVPMVSFAQKGAAPSSPTGVAPADPNEGRIANPIPSVTSIPNLIRTILIGAIKIGIPVIALAIVYCGFLFVSARGNSEKITKAKDALLYTLIGAGILLGSWAIAELISETVSGLG